MPWYKSGTVAVTQNSSAVIGSGTAFIANSRVGDAFRGPDGGWYEITNIASDTAMSISPNYQGATNGAGGYALAPLQGYVKESADRLRALILQYGDKLAALGTTGNYDILPLTKGGTGRSDGRALFSEVGVQQAAALFGTQGMYFGWNASQSGEGHFVVNRGGGQGGFTWRSVNAANSATGPTMSYSYDGLLAVPSLTTSSPIAVASGGTGGNTPAAARLGLQLSNSATMPAVGTVGQSSGTPTGAIIERGSNSSGEYTRYADGTQICTFKIRTIKTLSNSTGSLFFAAAEPARSFAMPFSSPPAVSITAALESGEGWFAGTGLVISSSQWPSGYVFTQTPRTAQQVALEYIAIGRWF
ncbi:phage tail protein [Pseudomonas viridiflava]|uniref:phage tail protein n=1 Tax=Pseudomonas viridiflava TaxID=33069 RepID=UPI001F12239F|nr:phage tail protein [Pseudomonas viridiflava]